MKPMRAALRSFLGGASGCKIEERIVTLHRSKRELADSLLADSNRAASLSSKELRALLEVRRVAALPILGIVPLGVA